MTHARLVDLSHVIEHGMVTYPGLPGPAISDHLSREASRPRYAAGTEFQIGKIDMVGNTGTYLDAPFHRYASGIDLAGLPLESLADVPAIVVRVVGHPSRAIDRDAFDGLPVRGRAVLVHTGWDTRWGTGRYGAADHPHLTEAAARLLADAGARLVGIDGVNIDDMTAGARPVHSVLLAAGVPIVEHLTNLGALPDHGFRFFAVPPKVRAFGTFPVRAFAVV